MSNSSDWRRLLDIFQPYTTEKLNEVSQFGARFAYYTTADVALSIFKRGQLWMRNVQTMNDFMEARHGFDCLSDAFAKPAGISFLRLLNERYNNLGSEVMKQLQGWNAGILLDTFATCFSEHPYAEDDHGRLSMWRAYGGKAGVALVFNVSSIMQNDADLGIHASPVKYATRASFASHFEPIVEVMNTNEQYLSELDRSLVRNAVFHALRMAVLCTKHPGFSEEREWRVIASPTMYRSTIFEREVDVARGIPQLVLKLNLKLHAESALDLSVGALIDRVVVGPCEHPVAIAMALQHVLSEAGVAAADKRIAVSRIPLRHT